VYAGHVGLALGLRRVPGAPALWLLVLAAQGPDWGDVLAEVAGLVPADPGWGPHGLPLLAAGAVAVGALAARLAPAASRPRAALVAGGAYLSHWACDYVTGQKPTWPGGPMLGRMLYDHGHADFALEAAVIVVGWALWRTTLPPLDGRPGARRARLVPALLLVALLALQAMANRALVRGIPMI
jgi:hypothetical protein